MYDYYSEKRREDILTRVTMPLRSDPWVPTLFSMLNLLAGPSKNYIFALEFCILRNSLKQKSFEHFCKTIFKLKKKDRWKTAPASNQPSDCLGHKPLHQWMIVLLLLLWLMLSLLLLLLLLVLLLSLSPVQPPVWFMSGEASWCTC